MITNNVYYFAEWVNIKSIINIKKIRKLRNFLKSLRSKIKNRR
jgi:hypothetical protein